MWALAVVTATTVATVGVYDVEHRCHWAAAEFQKQGVAASCIQTQLNPNQVAEDLANTKQMELWASDYNARKNAVKPPVAK